MSTPQLSITALMEERSTPNSTASSSPSATTSAASTTSTFAAPTPTYTPISDCPASNNTGYTSTYAQGSAGSVPAGAALTFTKYCDLTNPLTQSGATRIAQAFVYSFSDCVEVCAGYNFNNAGGNCTIAVYRATGSRPSNCWVGSTASSVSASSLGSDEGTDVALLRRS
ncbi:hypothetical protein BAUCODRAFT_559168 [Baudoinia panamericana UAMH 10762]|uniref:Uncharacterized protein n=1 Tax=Baudoinia panamericana (strain UAMH 10762) TaxID=717646 RepID=M2MDX3_BAUPA|nr:uncharacterized protein BAUCODRAFT_559168 [Baudoinia panamericana UAMH 10762]EMC94766.1 hypothetical protein BAUCODRAFT_559168 [Baudoinia panamericana UAMH 10762]